MIPPHVDAFVENHWTPISATLSGGLVFLGAFWAWIVPMGGKPCLERWNINVEKPHRREATDKLKQGMRALQKPGKQTDLHENCIIAGLDQLHKCQVRFDKRYRTIQFAHRLSIVAAIMVVGTWAAHLFDVDDHKLCSGMIVCSLLSFTVIAYSWAP